MKSPPPLLARFAWPHTPARGPHQPSGRAGPAVSRGRLDGSPRHPRGFSLIESLIGFLILGLGMLGVTEMESVVLGASSDSHQRNAAVHMAQDRIEQFRAWCPSACALSYDGIASGSDTPASQMGAQFSRAWTVTDNTGSGQPRFKTVTVTVTWEGKQGSSTDVSTRQVTLQTKISAVPMAVVPATPSPPPSS